MFETTATIAGFVCEHTDRVQISLPYFLFEKFCRSTHIPPNNIKDLYSQNGNLIYLQLHFKEFFRARLEAYAGEKCKITIQPVFKAYEKNGEMISSQRLEITAVDLLKPVPSVK
jgi:hypothetical protein